MPTYGYHCESCSTDFDVWQRMSDQPTAGCPTCGASGRRLFFPAGIVFKGSGFYKTDSRTTANGAGSHSSSTTTGGTKSSGAVTPPAKSSTKE